MDEVLQHSRTRGPCLSEFENMALVWTKTHAIAIVLTKSGYMRFMPREVEDDGLEGSSSVEVSGLQSHLALLRTRTFCAITLSAGFWPAITVLRN